MPLIITPVQMLLFIGAIALAGAVTAALLYRAKLAKCEGERRVRMNENARRLLIAHIIIIEPANMGIAFITASVSTAARLPEILPFGLLVVVALTSIITNYNLRDFDRKLDRELNNR